MQEQAIEITSSQYMDLVDPEFVGQTRLNVENKYWMFFKCKGILYKIEHTL